MENKWKILTFVGVCFTALAILFGPAVAKKMEINATGTAEIRILETDAVQSTFSPTHTQTLEPSATNTSTPTNTFTPEPSKTPTPIPTPSDGFDDKCIDSNIWSYYEGASVKINKDGCYSMGEYGFIEDKIDGKSGLFIDQDVSYTVDRGIYRQLSLNDHDVKISFILNIETFTASTSSDDAWIDIFIGLSSAEYVTSGAEGQFIFFRSSSLNNQVYIVYDTTLGDNDFDDFKGVNISDNVKIEIEVTQDILTIYIDDELVETHDFKIDFDHFWMGFRINDGGSVKANIFDYQLISTPK